MINLSKQITITIRGIALMFACAALANAQTNVPTNQGGTTNPPGPTATGKIVKPNSPYTAVEANVGFAIEALCPSLVGRTQQGQNNSAQLDLQVRCTEMVVAQDSNGVSGSSTADVMRGATAEEAATQGTQLVELSALRTTNIIARINELRTASSGGSTVAFDERSGVATFSQNFGGSAGGDDTFSPWGLYANGTLSTGDREETANESGFDFDGGAITLGADYRSGDSTFVGLSATWGTADAELLNGSKVDSDGIGIVAYATTYLKNDVYIDGTLGFGNHDYDQVRRISYDLPNAGGTGVTSVRQDANSSTQSDSLVASIGAGKDISRGANTFSVSGHLAYLDADIDGYQENINNTNPGFGLALEVDKQTIESLRSVIGLQLSRAISTSKGVTVPYVRADWVHEFENGQRNTLARFDNDPYTTGGFLLPDGTPGASTFALTTEAPDEDYFRLGAGVSAVWAGGWQGFLALDTLLGMKNIDAYSFTFGLRKDL